MSTKTSVEQLVREFSEKLVRALSEEMNILPGDGSLVGNQPRRGLAALPVELRKEAGRKAALTRKRRVAGRKAAETRRRNRETI